MARELYSKIKSLDELSKMLILLKKKGKTIVHCHGVFDPVGQDFYIIRVETHGRETVAW